MGELINLNKFRKRKARAEAGKQAASNRAKFGRNKAERDQDADANRRANDLLDQHLIENENET